MFDELRRRVPDLCEGLDTQLVRHLMVTHHGRARPLLPPMLDPEAPATRLVIDGIEITVPGANSQVDWDQPARFEALGDRYGWWGLAYLETLVRLADMLCSERTQTTATEAPSRAAVG
jgi:CRISPR-associated endonuclease/helicase Cas3